MAKDRARLNSLRLSEWDYSGKGLYFITMVTENRNPFFGQIMEGEMILSPMGEIALHEWFRSPELRPDMNLHLFEFVVMPDHVHALIGIGANTIHKDREPEKNLSTFGPQRNNLASVIRGYKSAVTTQSRKLGAPFGWQRGYHDMIIRDKRHLLNVARYIRKNPENYI
ncbi:MAG: transposase [Bacteroidia bacterium]|nr:transposase [Bacteroidia bacterium]